MPKLPIILWISFSSFVIGCTSGPSGQSSESQGANPYELYIPPEQKATLVLFGGYGETPEQIRTEFKIKDIAFENGVTLLLMDYSRRLWLEKHELIKLEELLQNIFSENRLNSQLFIGGFSSGGNVSLLLGNFLARPESKLKRTGIFSVDAPVDLLSLHEYAVRDYQKNKDRQVVGEAEFLIDVLEGEFGVGDTAVTRYEQKSPFVHQTKSLINLQNLVKTDIRLYTEPDTTWWREYRNASYEDVNASRNENLYNTLKENHFKVEFIKTSDRGYRADGRRHPHSWSIVDEKELVGWMLQD